MTDVKAIEAATRDKMAREMDERISPEVKKLHVIIGDLPMKVAKNAIAALDEIMSYVRDHLGERVGTCEYCDAGVYDTDEASGAAGHIGEAAFCRDHYQDELKASQERYREAVAKGDIVEHEDGTVTDREGNSIYDD